jgi:hypothetical protein
MANRRLSLVAGVMGVSAGLAPYLPTVVCPGVACTSCFACVGAGGAAASALVVGLISRRFGKSAPDKDEPSPAEADGGVTTD